MCFFGLTMNLKLDWGFRFRIVSILSLTLFSALTWAPLGLLELIHSKHGKDVQADYWIVYLAFAVASLVLSARWFKWIALLLLIATLLNAWGLWNALSDFGGLH